MKFAVLTTIVFGFFAAGAHEAPTITFVADSSALTGPETVPAGYVRLALDNQDEVMRAHGIFRVKEGADLEEAKGLMPRFFGGSGGEVTADEVFALTDGFYGGAVFVPPGTRKEVGVTLRPGTYVVYADGITDTGLSMTPAYITTLAVTQAGHSAAPPTPDYTVKMVDHAFAFPAGIKEGRHLFRVENVGHHDHMMFVSKLLPGKTLADVTALLGDENSDPTTVMEEETFGVHALWPGLFNDVVFDLEPGEYAAVCFATDPETGVPHAMLGMTQTFTVAAAGGR